MKASGLENASNQAALSRAPPKKCPTPPKRDLGQWCGIWGLWFSASPLPSSLPLANGKGRGYNRVIRMRIPDWLMKPETLFAIGLFLLGVLVSVFSTDIRRFLSLPPRKWKKARAARLRYRLNLTKRLHNDPYRLLLYLLWSIAEAGWQVVITFLPALWILSFLPVFTGKPKQPFNLEGMLMPASGILFSWIWNLRKTVDDLYHYDERTKYYEDQIKRLDPEPVVIPAVQAGDSPTSK